MTRRRIAPRARTGQLRPGGVHISQGGSLELWREARLAAVGPSAPGARPRAAVQGVVGVPGHADASSQSPSASCSQLARTCPKRFCGKEKEEGNDMYHIGVKFATADCVLVQSSITRCFVAVVLGLRAQASPDPCLRRLRGTSHVTRPLRHTTPAANRRAARDGLDRRCMFGTSELAQCTALVDLG